MVNEEDDTMEDVERKLRKFHADLNGAVEAAMEGGVPPDTILHCLLAILNFVLRNIEGDDMKRAGAHFISEAVEVVWRVAQANTPTPEDTNPALN